MKLTVLATATVLSVAVLAACGGDNKSVTTSTASGAGAATTTASGSATTSRSSSATTGGSGSDADTTAPSFSGDSNNKFCQTARDLENSDLGSSLSGDTSNLKEDLQKIHGAFDDLKSSAPSEIKDDVATLASAFDKLDAFWAQYDYDQAKLTAAATKDPALVEQATSAIADPAFTTAAGRITAYASQVCGISDDSTATSA
jgi:hypothetical protein